MLFTEILNKYCFFMNSLTPSYYLTRLNTFYLLIYKFRPKFIFIINVSSFLKENSVLERLTNKNHKINLYGK